MSERFAFLLHWNKKVIQVQFIYKILTIQTTHPYKLLGIILENPYSF